MSVTVVTGAPCAGKSTYIRERAQPGDIVIDLDRIALALSVEGTPDHGYPPHVVNVAIKAREAAVNRALQLSYNTKVWVIHTAPNPRQLGTYRAMRAEVVLVDPGMSVCMERATRLRPYAIPVIRRFYEGTLAGGRGVNEEDQL